MSLSFRDASIEDVSLPAALNRRLIRDEGRSNPTTPARLEGRMRKWLGSGEYSAVLFVHETPLAGDALFRRDPDFVYLRRIYVLPEFRREGIARTAIERLRHRRWQEPGRIRIDALVGNVAARESWQAVGFTEYRVTMERDLSAGDCPCDSGRLNSTERRSTT